jgi:hypothetical protein
MSKKLKLYIIGFISFLMVSTWAAIYFSGSIGQSSNNAWQAGMAATALIFGLIGMLTAKQWGWFKSNVGRSVFFLALGLIFWGIGQSYWTYYLIADPSAEVPQSYVMDVVLISVIPVWIYGILSLAKATGAKYGFKDAGGSLIAVMMIIFMFMFSYFTLVLVARDGVLFSDEQTAWQSIFDLAFPIGDAVLLTLSILIFVFSWNYLGGRFKQPILIILTAFVLLFIADFSFSFTDGNDTYYNGNVVDLFFILMVITLGLGIAMLDPRHTWKKNTLISDDTAISSEPSVEPTTNTQPSSLQATDSATANDEPPVQDIPKIDALPTLDDAAIQSEDLSQNTETPPSHDAEYLHQPTPEYQQERQQ